MMHLDLQPHGVRHAIALARGDVIRRERAARAIVQPRTAGLLRRLAFRFQLVRPAVAVVRLTLGDELGRHRAVAIDATGLKVRLVRPADLRPFIPVETEPAQPVEDAVDHFVRRALDIRVFDPQDEHAAEAPSEEPVEERGARTADVEVPGRRRSESNTGSRHEAFTSRR